MIISSLSLCKPPRAVDAAGNLPLVGIFLWVLLCCHIPTYTTFLTPGSILHFVHKETYHPPTRMSVHFHALTVFRLANNGAKPDWSHELFEFSGVGDGSHWKVVVEDWHPLRASWPPYDESKFPNKFSIKTLLNKWVLAVRQSLAHMFHSVTWSPSSVSS